MKLSEEMRDEENVEIPSPYVHFALVEAWADEVEKMEEIIRLFVWATSGNFDEREAGDVGDIINDALERWKELRERFATPP